MEDENSEACECIFGRLRAGIRGHVEVMLRNDGGNVQRNENELRARMLDKEMN